jgi:hypothetical protein
MDDKKINEDLDLLLAKLLEKEEYQLLKEIIKSDGIVED